MKIYSNLLLNILILLARADDIVKMVQEENLTVESHYVTTEDGYILNIHRIPQVNSNGTAEVMFLMHGLESASQTFVVHPRKRSAGFFFHALGYDIWMGNARGNMFSRNHTSLDPDEHEFWKFSWHEIGYYDLPAMIDYVLEKTELEQIHYIGHSQGVTSVFVLLSERPEYNEKFKLIHAMTPPIILKHYTKHAPSSMKNVHEMEDWVTRTGNYEFLAYKDYIKILKFNLELCVLPVVENFCRKLTEHMIGPISPYSYYDHIFLDYSTNIPAGSSYRQLMHYAQIALSGKFQKFDYGSEQNQNIYGSVQPPEYNYSNIQTKLHIMYGTNDILVMPANMPQLLKKVEHAVVAVNKIDLFNHLDFCYGRRVQSIQKKIFKVIEEFT